MDSGHRYFSTTGRDPQNAKSMIWKIKWNFPVLCFFKSMGKEIFNGFDMFGFVCAIEMSIYLVKFVSATTVSLIAVVADENNKDKIQLFY